MVSKFTFLFAVHLSTCIDVPFNTMSGREKLLALLGHFDDGSLQHYIDSPSFLQRTVSGGGAGGGGSAPEPSRRRVDSHAPCECPELLDTVAAPCLSKRKSLAQQSMAALSNAGDAPVSGSMTLRTMFSSVGEHVASIESRIVSIYGILNKGKDGSMSMQGSIGQQVLALRKIASAMATCLNEMWGQSFVVDDTTKKSLGGLKSLVVSQMKSIVGYLNAQQVSEERVTSSNAARGFKILNAQLANALKQINAISRSVNGYLTKLSANSDNSENSSTKLADSLVAASDLLSGKIAAYAAKVSDFLTKTQTAISDSVQKSQVSFHANVDQLIAQLTTQARSKLAQFSKTNKAAVAADRTTFTKSVLGPVSSSAAAGIKAVTNAIGDFVKISQKQIYTQTQAAIDPPIASASTTVRTQVLKARTKLDEANSQMGASKARVSQLMQTSAKNAAGRQSVFAQNKAGATKSSLDILANLPLAAHAALTTATTVKEGAVEAVGVDLTGHNDKMFQQLTTISNEFTQTSNDQSLASSKTAGGLELLVTKSVSAVDSSSGKIGQVVGQQFGQYLNNVSSVVTGQTLPHNLTQISSGITNLQTVSSLAGNNASSASSAKALAGNAAVHSLLATIMNSSHLGKGNITQIQNHFAAQLRASASHRAAGQHVDKDSRARLAGAAGSLGHAQDVLVSILSRQGLTGSALLDAPVANLPTGPLKEAVAQLARDKLGRLNTNVGLASAQSAIAANGADVESIGAARASDLSSSVAETTRRLLDHSRGPASSLAQTHLSETSKAQSHFMQNLDRTTLNALNGVHGSASATDSAVGAARSLLLKDLSSLHTMQAHLPVEVSKFVHLFAGASTPNKTVEWDPSFISQSTAVMHTATAKAEGLGFDFNKSADAIFGKTNSNVSTNMQNFVNLDEEIEFTLQNANSAVVSVDTALVSPEDLRAAQERIAQVLSSQATNTILTADGVSAANASTSATALLKVGSAAAATSMALVSNLTDILNSASGEVHLKSTIDALAAKASQATALGKLQANVQASDLARKADLNRQIGLETRGILNQYTSAIKAGLDSNSPEIVYNSVLKNRQDVANQINSLINKAVALNTNLTGALTTGPPTALTKFLTRSIQKLFNSYTTIVSTGSRLEKVQDQIDNGNEAVIAGEVVRPERETETTLNQTNAFVIGQFANVRNALIDYTEKNYDLDTADARIRSNIQNWKSDTKTDITEIGNSIPTIDSKNVMKRVTNQINSTVDSLITMIERSYKNLSPDQIAHLESVRAKYPVLS